MKALKLLIFLCCLGLNCNAYSEIDSVIINKNSSPESLHFYLYSAWINNVGLKKITRIEENFYWNDTLLKIDIYFRACEGPTVDDYFDSIIELTQVYPELYNLEVNLMIDTNTWSSNDFHSDSICWWAYEPILQDRYYLPINEQILTTSEFNFHSSSIKIYPNPTEDILTVEIIKSLSLSNFEILDSMGRTLIEGEFSTNIDVKDLPPGYYIIRLKNENGFIIKKFIKN